VATGSSAKKVARLAQKGKGKKVRFQGGTLFPTVMSVVVVLGLGLIAFARQAPASTSVAPTANDSWNIAYGIYKCDAFLPHLAGTKEKPLDPNFVKYGVNSKDDGIIHWNAKLPATGKDAKLGLFLDTYGVSVDPKGMKFPADQNKGVSYTVAKDKCKDKSGKLVDAQIQVIVWENYDKPDLQKKYITDFNNIRIKNDKMAITIAFVAPGANIPQPDSSSDLAKIGNVGSVTTTTAPKTSTTTAVTSTTGG